MIVGGVRGSFVLLMHFPGRFFGARLGRGKPSPYLTASQAYLRYSVRKKGLMLDMILHTLDTTAECEREGHATTIATVQLYFFDPSEQYSGY